MSTFLLGMKGQVAALAGLSLEANPYRLNTVEGLRWVSAWAAAMAELSECSEFGAGRELG